MDTNVSQPGDHERYNGGRGTILWDNRSGSGGGLLEWWYRLAAPQEPQNSTASDREMVRAGRLSSIIFLIMFGFGLSQLPTALTGTNHTFLSILLIALALSLVTFFLNRQGHVLLGGMINVLVVECAFIVIVLTSPVGISSRTLTVFYLVILTELMAVSLLPPRSVFLAALCNCLFTWIAISFLPHASDFIIKTPAAYYAAIASPLLLQIIVAIVTYLWAQGARQAIARAEQIAALERALAEKDRAAAEDKEQLEYGIQQILQTHIQVANGNVSARAPLSKDHVLWQVSYSLNNLLTRLQRATQAESECEQMKREVVRLTDAVRHAKGSRYPVPPLSRGGTSLDTLIQEISGTSINPPR